MRLKRREVDEKSRKVEDLERIIREFDQMAADLERQIQLEEDRTGIRDRVDRWVARQTRRRRPRTR